MMQTTIHEPLIIIIGAKEKHQKLLHGWREYQHHDNFRTIKKLLSRQKPALIVACIYSEEDKKISQQVTQYIRDGLCNIDTRIVIMRDPLFELDEITWMEQRQVNCCLLAEEKKQHFNFTALNREIDTFLHIDNNRIQHDAESTMLMCITQFSRENEPLEELLKSFSATLSRLCYSSCSFHIKIQEDNTGEIQYFDREDISLIDDLNQAFNLPAIPDYLQSVLIEKHPQIDLIPETINLKNIEEKIDIHIGSCLTFPIVAYNKVLYLLFYLIPEEKMDKVSMKQINVINKASEQLTILLERRQAESSLKKQYERLKNTLVELKSTKAELQNKEKMASIGQMAAGIAHEINNPLSYVISNFSSMENYLKSIMQLQHLQSEFLTSIEEGQDKKFTDFKENISQFEKEQDIPFILEDIHAVVSDSYHGLQRVKNIINDLKSFTYSQSTQLEQCDLALVINETLKILQYNIDDTITIEKSLNELPTFMAHNGLMQQVLTNLIKNAAQALQTAQTENPIISITATCDAQSVFIKIKDNGPGIPEAAQQKIFEPFFTTKTVGEGTGLGLSVTFNIVKKLQGEITLNSEPGQFTEFCISFPISAQ